MRKTPIRFACFASRFCTFGICILLYLKHLFFFLNCRTDSWENDFSFLNLTKTECIVGELFKNQVNSCPRIRLCADLIQPRVFLNRFPLHIIRRENSVFPYFISFPMDLSKESQRAKERKVLICTRTLLLRKTFEKGTEKWKLSTVAANSNQVSLPWCDTCFHKKRSTKTALE